MALELDLAAWADTEDLALFARGVVEGMLAGLHRSPYLGYGREFSSYRPYARGDTLKHVDWKVWSRTDTWYVKQFEDETNLLGRVFLDASASMGTGELNKFLHARRLAAALAYLMIVQRDAPGLVVWNESELHYLPPRHSKQQIELWAELSKAQVSGRAGLPTDLQHLLASFTRRGLAIVISDFLAEDGEAVELCETLRHHRQEVVAFQLLSPEECDLLLGGNLVLVDSETGEERLVDPEVARREYQERFEAHCAGVQKRCWEAGVDYHRLRTDEPLEESLRAYLVKREAMPLA